jgi:iron complex outermembrane receptor protein
MASHNCDPSKQCCIYRGINRTDLKGDGVILTSVLNKIPGVYMQQGALNTNRISIRGIGSRAQYGTKKNKSVL